MKERRRALWRHLVGPLDRLEYLQMRCSNLDCMNPAHASIFTSTGHFSANMIAGAAKKAERRRKPKE